MSVRKVAKVVNPDPPRPGSSVDIKKSIGANKQFNPFLVFDHFTIPKYGGFPAHPHRGQETVTLVLQKGVAHEDFTGSKGILYAGDMQFMTAGKGIVHAEMPIPSDDGSPCVGLQLWVDLPNHMKDITPRYRDLREWEIPEVVADDGKVSVRIISGRSHGTSNIKKLTVNPIHYYQYKVKAGGEFKQEMDYGFNYFMYVYKGNDLVVNGDAKVDQFKTAFFEEQGDYIVGKNTATVDTPDTEIEFVLIGGKKLNQKIVQYGPFVAKNKSGINDAMTDFELAMNGFEKRRNWNSLISYGVSKSMVNGQLNGSLEKRAEAKQAYLDAKDVRIDVIHLVILLMLNSFLLTLIRGKTGLANIFLVINNNNPRIVAFPVEN
ncbi:hypothetical protein G210_1696 [Candida maltosa Xu316]|uniref:Pirin n=1 Tax=Candida maltosa (strain Xu316) TaxID=1245528 RepID=M3HKC8_CANMX|nr:hypothetical protein G210_1696 [Candida maltosa Xu316]